VQLSCTSHPTYSKPADYGTGTDTGLQSYPVQDRLLQCCAPRRSKLQHQEVAASTEHAARIVLEAPRRSHVSPLLRTLHLLPVHQRIDYKFGSADIQSPQHLDRLRRSCDSYSRIENTATTCDRPLRRCVNPSRRQHLRNALFDALHQPSGTHYRRLFSIVTLFISFNLILIQAARPIKHQQSNTHRTQQLQLQLPLQTS